MSVTWPAAAASRKRLLGALDGVEVRRTPELADRVPSESGASTSPPLRLRRRTLRRRRGPAGEHREARGRPLDWRPCRATWPVQDLVAVAQLVRASGCGPEGRGFESRQSPSCRERRARARRVSRRRRCARRRAATARRPTRSSVPSGSTRSRRASMRATCSPSATSSAAGSCSTSGQSSPFALAPDARAARRNRGIVLDEHPLVGCVDAQPGGGVERHDDEIAAVASSCGRRLRDRARRCARCAHLAAVTHGPSTPPINTTRRGSASRRRARRCASTDRCRPARRRRRPAPGGGGPGDHLDAGQQAARRTPPGARHRRRPCSRRRARCRTERAAHHSATVSSGSSPTSVSIQSRIIAASQRRIASSAGSSTGILEREADRFELGRLHALAHEQQRLDELGAEAQLQRRTAASATRSAGAARDRACARTRRSSPGSARRG